MVKWETENAKVENKSVLTTAKKSKEAENDED